MRKISYGFIAAPLPSPRIKGQGAVDAQTNIKQATCHARFTNLFSYLARNGAIWRGLAQQSQARSARLWSLAAHNLRTDFVRKCRI
jgi:hypothetical protein